jgi:hypothetical protein
MIRVSFAGCDETLYALSCKYMSEGNMMLRLSEMENPELTMKLKSKGYMRLCLHSALVELEFSDERDGRRSGHPAARKCIGKEAETIRYGGATNSGFFSYFLPEFLTNRREPKKEQGGAKGNEPAISLGFYKEGGDDNVVCFSTVDDICLKIFMKTHDMTPTFELYSASFAAAKFRRPEMDEDDR